MAPTQKHRWFTRPDTSRHRRDAALVQFVLESARADFFERYPTPSVGPVVALIAAYEEERNLGAVLETVPEKVGEQQVTPLVIVDGGSDHTAEVSFAAQALTCVLPVNLGQGAALRVGYGLASELGARYVVTLDADGQNDPAELGVMLEPLLDGAADFVIASRRLGQDQTTDRFRRAGVRLYAALLNTIVGQRLTDSSNGYRSFRIELLDDIIPHLRQDQYQTAEVVIVAATRGWRITEAPTVWHPRASGASKKGGNLVFGLHYAEVILTTWRRMAREARKPRGG
ncbi:MAG: glycosyltransferase family 2 protein [Acidimicrobiales bacterium]